MTDTELIQATLSDDMVAFKTLVERYQQKVFGTAMGFLHSAEDAEELSQDVFLKVFQKLDTFEQRSKFSTWLYRIAVNECLNEVKKKRMLSFFLPLDSLLAQPSSKDSPQDDLETRELRGKIATAIDSLPTKQRSAFILRYYEELPQKEIASIMNLSEGSVEQLLQRAKKNLQKKLKQSIG